MSYGKRARRLKGVVYWESPRDDTPKIGSLQAEDLAKAEPADVGPFFIFGRRASDLEWRTYKTLRKLGWSDDQIQFQVDVMGGHLPGGVVLDFLLESYGMPTVIEPNGDHWHNASETKIQRDRARFQQIANAWRKPFKYLAIPQGEILTDEMAFNKLLREVGRA